MGTNKRGANRREEGTTSGSARPARISDVTERSAVGPPTARDPASPTQVHQPPDGAEVHATAERLRSELEDTWQRALSARQRRDVLLAEQRQLVVRRRRLGHQATKTESEADQGRPDSLPGPDWVVAAMKSDLFKALAHPVRVRALELLADGDRSVGWLTEAMTMEISHLSHHLAVLRRAGLVDSRREGSVVHYWLRQPQYTQILAIVAGEMVWDTADYAPDSG